MYPYIVCYCGRSIGDVYDVFCKLRIQKYNEAFNKNEASKYDIDPNMLSISEIVDVDLTDVFEQLNIHTDCCRTRLTTQVQFKEYY